MRQCSNERLANGGEVLGRDTEIAMVAAEFCRNGRSSSVESTWDTMCPRALSSLSRWPAMPIGNMSRISGLLRNKLE
jgi:hypothetical protein